MTTATTGHRQRYLRDALDELYSGIQRPTRNGRQASIRVGSRTVSLETWEWDALVEWSASPSSDPTLRWRTLVVEALALQARFHSDLERVTRAPDSAAEESEAARSDLHLDAILAFRILSELQRETERMVVSGGMDQAKRLTQFRRRLSECLSSAGKALGEPALKEAEAIAAQAATAAPTPARVRPVEEDRDDRLQALFALEEQLLKRENERDSRQSEGAAAEPVATSPRKRAFLLRAMLLTTLAIAIAAWATRSALDRSKPAVRRELERGSFASLTAVRAVYSRAPSLFVVVDTPLWKDLSASERLAVVEQIAGAAGAAGYSGAVVRTTEGAIVGQWLKSGGPRVFQPGT